MKIVAFELHRVDYPFEGYFKFIGPAAVRPAVLVRLIADNGVCGWGSSLPVTTWSFESPAATELVLREHFCPALLGRDPLDLEGAQQALDRSLAWSFGTPMPISRAGVDLALHDLEGKLLGAPVAARWGREAVAPVQLSWTVNVASIGDAQRQLEAGAARGYRNFNIKIAPDPEFDVELARQVRRFVPEGFVWADANCGYDLETALAVAPRLADVGVDVLESPFPPNRIAAYQALRRQGALPITMDEGMVSPVEVDEFIRLGMIDGLTVKVSRTAGLESARRQIERVLDAGLFWLGSGLTDPDISLAASLLLFSAYGLQKPAALNGPQFLTADVLARPLEVDGDIAWPPQGPGLGVDVDEQKLATLRK